MENTEVKRDEIFLDKDISIQSRYAKEHLINDLSLNNEMGLGRVLALNQSPEFSSLIFDINLNEDFKIAIKGLGENQTCFMYGLKGDAVLSFSNSDEIHQLHHNRTVIAKGNQDTIIRLSVKGQSNLFLNVIVVDSQYLKQLEHFFKDDFNLGSTPYSDMINRENFYYEGSDNVKVMETIRDEYELNFKNGMASYILRIGKQFKIFSHLLEQMSHDLNTNHNTSGLRRCELMVISEIANEIRINPEVQYSVEMLCEKSGLAAAKLQGGFKYLYNRTVADYVRFYRLERAELLIRTSDLTISEIVYTVGLTSRSYFCKIFKGKFGASPRLYRRSLKKLAQLT